MHWSQDWDARGIWGMDLSWLLLWVVMAAIVWFFIDRSVKGPRQGGES